MRPDQISQAQDLLGRGGDIASVAAAVGLEIGDVQTIATSVTLIGDYPRGSLIRGFPFQHDTPGLLQGIPLLTPKPGDLLVDAWVSVMTPWNVMANCNFGVFPPGFLMDPLFGSAFDMTGADRASVGGDLLVVGDVAFSQTLGSSAPSTVLRSRPWLLVVSQDGTQGGADPGATQGDATLYLEMRPA